MTTSLSSIPDLRRLLFIGFVSSTVRWLETLAVALFAYKLTESAFVVAMLSMLRVLPMGLFGAFIGGAADRFELRRVLHLVAVVAMATTLALAVLASLGALEVWHLAVASFVNGVCWASDNPVRRMMIGNAVGPDRMGSAISLDVGCNNASRILGPMLAGLLLARYEMASVFWFGTLLYGASLAAALRMHASDRPAAVHASSFISSISEGLAWLRHDHRLVGVYVITVLFNIFGWPYTSMIPVIATDYFHLGPKGAGLLASCEGIGGLLGALMFARLANPRWYGRIYVYSVAFYFATMLGFAMAPVAPAAALILLCNGLSAVGFAVMQATLIYRDAPVEMRARLLGVLSVCIGTGPIGFIYLGFLAEALTPRAATAAMAAQGLLALFLTRRYWLAVFQSQDSAKAGLPS